MLSTILRLNDIDYKSAFRASVAMFKVVLLRYRFLFAGISHTSYRHREASISQAFTILPIIAFSVNIFRNTTILLDCGATKLFAVLLHLLIVFFVCAAKIHCSVITSDKE